MPKFQKIKSTLNLRKPGGHDSDGHYDAPNPSSARSKMTLKKPNPSTVTVDSAVSISGVPAVDAGTHSECSSRITKLFDVFCKSKPKNQSQPVDNFTRWDIDRSTAQESLPHTKSSNHALRYEVGSRAFILGLAYASSSSSAAPSSSKNNPFREARAVQQHWAFELDNDADLFDALEQQTDKDEGERLAIRDVDWRELDINDQLQEIFDMDSRDGPEQGGDSPTDSGVVLPDHALSYDGKGKGRAIGPESMASGFWREEDRCRLKEVLALEAALLAEMALQKSARPGRPHATRVQKNELDRMTQEEEDWACAKQIQEDDLARIQALKIQEEEDQRRAREIQEEQDRKIPLRDCVVCGDEKGVLEFPAKPTTLDCEHVAQTCAECMHAWLASEFETKGCAGVKCPQCAQELTYDDMQRAASATTLAAYEKLLTRIALSSLPEFSWCLAPGCESGQLNANNGTYMECVSCGYQQCLTHQRAWHTGETCAQYDTRTAGQRLHAEHEAATQAMLDEVSKLCPGPGCGWRIQKTDGCDHMTCKKCKFEFCWECRASHRAIKRAGNTAHESWCKFHSQNLDTAWPFNVH